MKKTVKHGRKVSAAFLGSMVLATTLTGGPAHAAVTSILEAPNASLPTTGEKADAKYEFIAQFNPELTDVNMIGDGWEARPFSEGGTDLVWNTIMPKDDQKGEIGVTYTNIGMYNGRQLDLTIMVDDWTSIYKDNAGISFSNTHIGITNAGYTSMPTTWTFTDHETGKPVAVNGYMTVTDIDQNQIMKMDAETMSHIDKIYVPVQDTVISYQENTDGSALFYSEFNGNNGAQWNLESSDDRGDFTFLYSDASTLHIDWGTEYSDATKAERSQMLAADSPRLSTTAYGAYFGYSAFKPLATEVLLPNKTVTDGNQQDVTENTLDTADEVNLYEVSHTVPAEIQDFYYQSYEVTDTLPDGLEAKGDPVIKDETGKDVTAQFDVTVDGTAYSFKAKAGTLAAADFYNHTYTFAIPTAISADRAAGIKTGDKLTFDNTANVIVDGETKASNKTVTTFTQPEPPTTETPSDPVTPPSTEAPSTEAPSTEEPSTEEPSTEEPSTEAPSTEAPSTEEPSTEAPSTEAPSTEAPSTEAPSTEEPTTEEPTTEEPTTEEPTTETPAEKTYKLEGIVFIDKDNDGKQGEDEVIVPDVTVKVTDENDDVVKEVKTDKDGHYDVTDLAPGTYHVSFETPDGYEGTTPEDVDVVIEDTDGRADYGINQPEPTTEEPTTEDVTTEEVTTEDVTTEDVTTEDVTTEDVTTEDVTTEAPSTEELKKPEPTTETVTKPAPPAETVTKPAPVQQTVNKPVNNVTKVLPNTGSAAGNIALYGGILGIAAYGIYRVARRQA